MDQLLAHLSQYHPISEAARQALADCLQEEVYPKNGMLISHGQVCRRLWFVESGCLRGYYHLEDKEITHWFGFERDFVTSFHSFTTGQPAVENIQLMEGSVLWSVSREELLRLLDKFHELERLVRIAYENTTSGWRSAILTPSSAPPRSGTNNCCRRLRLSWSAPRWGISPPTWHFPGNAQPGKGRI